MVKESFNFVLHHKCLKRAFGLHNGYINTNLKRGDVCNLAQGKDGLGSDVVVSGGVDDDALDGGEKLKQTGVTKNAAHLHLFNIVVGVGQELHVCLGFKYIQIENMHGQITNTQMFLYTRS